MKRQLLAAIVAMAATAPAWAQSSAATGTGVGVAGSTSTSQAISGQGGVGIAAITSNSSVPDKQTIKNVPSVFAPGLSAAAARDVPRVGFRRRRVRRDRNQLRHHGP